MSAVHSGKPAGSEAVCNPIRRIAIFSAMASEAECVQRTLGFDSEPQTHEGYVSGAYRGVTVISVVTEGGLAAAQKAAETLFTRFAGSVDHVFVAGRAAAYDLRHKVGEVITPEELVDRRDGIVRHPANLSDRAPLGVIYSSDKQRYDHGYIAELNSSNVSVIDRQSGAIAAVCQRYGCPITIVLAVSDHIDLLADPDDIFPPEKVQDHRAMIRFAKRRPRRIAHLITTVLGVRKAVAAAAGELKKNIDSLIEQGSASTDSAVAEPIVGAQVERPLLARTAER
jgi:nucleoside phosphorylase